MSPGPIKTQFLPVLGLCAALLAGCSSTPVTTPANSPLAAAPGAARVGVMPPAVRGPAASGSDAAGQDRAGAAAGRQAGAGAATAAQGLPQDASYFFDFDAAQVMARDMPTIERQGRYLVANPARNLRIEGNTDERGSSEYNLALGQKRADAVRRALLLLGARESQIEAISWGKERPRNPGHDETAWAANRRADLMFQR